MRRRCYALSGAPLTFMDREQPELFRRVRAGLVVVLLVASALRAHAADDGAASAAPPASLGRLASQADFDRLARVYHPGRGTPMPHVMFVIDRRPSQPSAIYYLDSKRFTYHRDFVRQAELVDARPFEIWALAYSNLKRRFVFGTVAWLSPLERFVFEFDAADQIDPAVLKQTAQLLAETSSRPSRFSRRTRRRRKRRNRRRTCPRCGSAT